MAILAIGFAPVRTPVAIATGELQWTRYSVCEWPMGHYLQYYITDNCGHELYFNGSLPQDGSWAGKTVWAEGQLVQNGSCRILDASLIDVCSSGGGPTPACRQGTVGPTGSLTGK